MKSSYILGIFSLVCFIAAMVFSADVSKVESKTISGTGGIYGPFTVKEKNSSYEIIIKNHVALREWSFIEVNVLDKDKNHLFGFGDGMWHESGYDDEGRWEESKTDYSMDVTFKDAGEYYFEIKSQSNEPQIRPITIKIVKERGSNVLFITLGILSLLAALFLFYMGSKFKKVNEPNKKHNTIIVVVLAIIFFITLLYSSRGWGYMGYNGYHHGPSFFYMGGPSIYHQRSNRDGSVSGAGQRGGGFNGGK